MDAERVYLNDMAPRDGLQIEPVFVATEEKVALIDALSHAGFAKIEVTSFTSPKAIPALADAEQVMARIERVSGVEYVALVPNLRGMERGLRCRVDEMNLVMSVSETHNLANLRMHREESFAQLAQVIRALEGTAVRPNVSLSTTFGCPMEGPIDAGEVFRWVARFVEASVRVGARRFDASLGGLGGCPYAPGATGNVCSEEVVHMLELMGLDTGVDLERALAASARLPGLLGHDVPSQLLKAGPVARLHPAPDWVRQRTGGA